MSGGGARVAFGVLSRIMVAILGLLFVAIPTTALYNDDFEEFADVWLFGAIGGVLCFIAFMPAVASRCGNGITYLIIAPFKWLYSLLPESFVRDNTEEYLLDLDAHEVESVSWYGRIVWSLVCAFFTWMLIEKINEESGNIVVLGIMSVVLGGAAIYIIIPRTFAWMLYIIGGLLLLGGAVAVCASVPVLGVPAAIIIGATIIASAINSGRA